MQIFLSLDDILDIVKKEMKRRDISAIVGENAVAKFAENEQNDDEIYGIEINPAPIIKSISPKQEPKPHA